MNVDMKLTNTNLNVVKGRPVGARTAPEQAENLADFLELSRQAYPENNPVITLKSRPIQSTPALEEPPAAQASTLPAQSADAKGPFEACLMADLSSMEQWRHGHQVEVKAEPPNCHGYFFS